ncbi:MAG: ligase-associated DNA damage response exonuclease [Paracoccaceae bacterium]
MAMETTSALIFTPKGIYCPSGDFYIDPWHPVERALITHGHADHARFGHRSYLSTDIAAPVIKHRLGDIVIETVPYGTKVKIGSATVSFHPAGHVPGSAQIRVEVGGELWVVSGDYKTENDGLSDAFEPVKCHNFITECTFGLPAFRWQKQSIVFEAINAWWQENARNGRVSVLGAYGLGKAQRLLCGLDLSIGPVLTHGAVEGTNRVMRAQGIALPPTRLVTQDTDKKAQAGAIVIAPPSAIDSAWARGFRDLSTAFVSGWMGLRGVRRRRAGDRGFVMSDHADWEGLNQAILETGAENIYVTHGYTDIFSKWLIENGYHAKVVPTQFGEDIEEEGDEA